MSDPGLDESKPLERLARRRDHNEKMLVFVEYVTRLKKMENKVTFGNKLWHLQEADRPIIGSRKASVLLTNPIEVLGVQGPLHFLLNSVLTSL